MKEIPLTRGYVALVDDEDYERVSAFKWHTLIIYRKDKTIANTYAVRTPSKQRSMLLHRFVLNALDSPLNVDHHPDPSGLNCRKTNLRLATSRQNSQNRRESTSNRAGMKGVTWRKDHAKWVAYIVVNGKRKYLGEFDDREEAGKAYDSSCIEHFGTFGKTNVDLGLLRGVDDV